MELESGDRALLDGCDDRAFVVDLGDGASRRRAGRVGVGEVDVGAVEPGEDVLPDRAASVFQPMCGTRRASRRRTGPRRSPRPVPPSSLSSNSNCMPTQIPSSGRPAAARSRSAWSTPVRASPSAALATCPTPATTASGDSRTSVASVVTNGSAPSRASAEQRLRRLPAP